MGKGAGKGNTESLNRDLGWVVLFLVILGVMWYTQGGNLNLSPFKDNIILEPPQKGADRSFFEAIETPPPKSEPPAALPTDSLFKDKISLRAGAVATSQPNEEYISLRTSSQNKEAVNITGWILQNKKGLKAAIGKGSILPFLASINPESDIFLEPGAEVIVITGKSPVQTSFRLNICTGYFNQSKNFIPSLPGQCPDPEEAAQKQNLYRLDDNICFNYVKSLSRCIMPLSTPYGLSDDCENFLSEHINYNGCVNDYKKEENFYSEDWRIYLGRDSEFWKERYEKITLLDKEGKIVSELSY
ncbi:MAG: hypothetical protein AAB564_00940 [Patescibacteria group bacterium]